MTGLPRRVSLAGATTSAVGCPSTGQVAVALRDSRPSRVVAGRPGAWTSALTSWTAAEAPLASALVTDLPMSALTRVTGPCWSTPSTVAVRTEPSRCAGVSTLLSAMFTGTSTVLFNRLTSRSSSTVTARALPVGEPGAAADAEEVGEAVGAVAWAADGGAISAATARAAAPAAGTETERDEDMADEDMAVPPRVVKRQSAPPTSPTRRGGAKGLALRTTSRQSSRTIRHMSHTERHFTR